MGETMRDLSDEDLVRAAAVPPGDAGALFFASMLLDFLIDNGDPRTFAHRAGIAGNAAAVDAMASRLPPELLAAARRP